MKQRKTGERMSDEERRVDLKPALVAVEAALGEQGRLLTHVIGKIDKVVDIVTEVGKWQAGHQAMTGEHEKTLHNLGCQAGDFVERITEAEKKLERHSVRIGVLWAIVGVLGAAMAVFGVQVFGGHLIKAAVLATGSGTALAALGLQKAILAFKGLL